MIINQVEPGTKIQDGHGGSITVTEKEAVVKGHEIYMTKNHYEAILKSPKVKIAT